MRSLSSGLAERFRCRCARVGTGGSRGLRSADEVLSHLDHGGGVLDGFMGLDQVLPVAAMDPHQVRHVAGSHYAQSAEGEMVIRDG